MSKVRCFNLLRDLNNTSSNLRYREDIPFQDILAITSAGDSNRLESANIQLHDATKKYEILLDKEREANENITALQIKLSQLEKKYEELSCGKILSSSTLESLETLKGQIANDKNILNFYRQATGLRLCFNAPDDVVAGYVAVKSTDLSESKIEPFSFKKSTKNLTNEIWKKISDVSEMEKFAKTNIVNNQN